jgi:peptidoglycan/xylan/chitin deacetylase (PgdA/CDA1 family)
VDGREVRVGAQSVRLSTRDRPALRRTFKRLRTAAKSEDRPDEEFAREMEDLTSAMEVEAGCSLMDIYEQDDWTAVLTWEEVERSEDDGVTFGSHTVDHVRLGRTSLDVARGQLLESKKAIEGHTHRPCRLLCYPNGSYNVEVAELARECGYACAVTTREGTNRLGDDPMTLRRIALPDDGSATEALARASGLSELIHKAKAGFAALVKGKPRPASPDGAEGQRVAPPADQTP